MKRRIPLLTICLLTSVTPILSKYGYGGSAQINRPPVPSLVVKNRPELSSASFYLLPLTSVKPKGWLRHQLEIQSSGLTGHLDEFWPDLMEDSGWLGGDGESWERGPYYMDGLVPLAYLLDDPKLIAKANKWVNWTLSHQRPDGSMGPIENQDWWPNMIMLKVLTQYQEATGDPRVIPLMERYFIYQTNQLQQHPLKEWAVYRWADELLSIQWLYNRTGNNQLLGLARQLHDQGYDWKKQFEHFAFVTKTSYEQLGLKPGGGLTDLALRAHGVNNAMAMKTAAVWWLVSHESSDRETIYRMLRELDRYHLLPNGMHSADEHYAGLNPTQGNELCSVVESMFSLEHLISLLGDPKLGDRLERIAFNAMPATFSGDMWAHQYDQQPNQIRCDIQQRDWTTNGPESNVFGLEPNFGCCTANMHQGWPKFVTSLWMATPDDGVAAVSYGPCEVNTVVRDGVRLHIVEETDYPFRGTIHLRITPEMPVNFPLSLRIPEWVSEPKVFLNGKPLQDIKPGSFHRIERQWNKGDKVVIDFPLRARTSRWYRDSITVEEGPLVFSLKISEDWQKIGKGMRRPASAPASDWEVHPTTPWNYGLILDVDHPEDSIEKNLRPVGLAPFTREGAPVELRLKGRRIMGWAEINGSAGLLPQSPASSSEPVEILTLIPYGSAKLRITAFPLLKQ